MIQQSFREIGPWGRRKRRGRRRTRRLASRLDICTTCTYSTCSRISPQSSVLSCRRSSVQLPTPPNTHFQILPHTHISIHYVLHTDCFHVQSINTATHNAHNIHTWIIQTSVKSFTCILCFCSFAHSHLLTHWVVKQRDTQPLSILCVCKCAVVLETKSCESSSPLFARYWRVCVCEEPK